ncbi:MAG: metallophosphoesterase [Candidatus Sumerlaeia bacterium]|nr:metallophosphoesterase [Candidatus Sumerlaeia bacterium]
MTIKTVRALHIGDLHFSEIPCNPMAYMPKRILGVGNLIVGGRRKKFRTSMGHLLIEKLELLKPVPDMFLFSGDFSSTALPGEFRQARELFAPTLEKWGVPAHVVPGNHDCYCGAERHARSFSRQLNDTFIAETGVSLHHPAEGIALLTINGTADNGLLGCHGAITPADVDRVRELLASIDRDTHKHLLILCHFPPEEPKPIVPHERGDQLREARPLLDVIATLPGSKIWMHGHHHYRWIYTSPTVDGLVYLNAGAPFLRHGRELPDLGFHELLLEGPQWRVRTHHVNKEGSCWLVVDPDIPAPGGYLDLQKLSG